MKPLIRATSPAPDGIRHDLLQPSLAADSAAEPRAAPYSETTGLVTAFFGGPFAITTLVGINAARTGRLARDAVWLGAMVVAYGVWLYLAYASPGAPAIQRFFFDLVGNGGLPMAERLMALLFMAGGYLLHRSEQRTATLFALRRPNGIVMGACLVVAGMFVTRALDALLVAGGR